MVSVFKDRIEKHKEEIAELDEIQKMPDRSLPVRDERQHANFSPYC